MGSYVARSSPRLSQGDIYRSVRIVEGSYPDGLRETTFGYSVLLSQDCDLEQDWNASVSLTALSEDDLDERQKTEDKVLRHVILAPCYVEEAFREGQHLAGREMQKWSSRQMENLIRPNKHIRYHHMPGESGLLEQALVVDFKHYFSVERDQFYEYAKQRAEFEYVCSVAVLYREALSKRFGDYLARIGFPEDDEVVRGTRSHSETQ